MAKSKAPRATTVEDIARMIRERKISTDTAKTLLSSVRGTTILSTVGSTTELDDLESPDVNDVMHLETLRTLGVITPEEFHELVTVMSA